MKKRKISIVSIAIFLLFSLLASTAVAREQEWKIRIGGSNFLFDVNEYMAEVDVYVDNDAHTFVGTWDMVDVQSDTDLGCPDGRPDWACGGKRERSLYFTLGGTFLRVKLSEIFSDNTYEEWGEDAVWGYTTRSYCSRLGEGISADWESEPGVRYEWECRSPCNYLYDDDCLFNYPDGKLVPCSRYWDLPDDMDIFWRDKTGHVAPPTPIMVRP